MPIPRSVQKQRRVRRSVMLSYSYIAARTREKARLRFLSAEIRKLEKIAALKRGARRSPRRRRRR